MKMELQDKVLEIVKKIEEASPEIWRVYIKQAYADVIGNCLVISLMMFFTRVTYWGIYKLGESADWPHGSYDSFGYYEVGIGLANIIFCVLAGFLIWNIGELVKTFINPKFYAMDKLRAFIKGEYT